MSNAAAFLTETAARPSRPGVAITGIGLSCGLGTGTEQVWKAIQAGDSGIGRTERIDVSTLSCKYAAEIPELPPVARRPRGRLDRATRLALHAAGQALGTAGIDLGAFDPYRVGVALGTSVGGLEEGERFHWELLAGRRGRPAGLLNYPLYTSADALSVAYQLRGPKVVISNACAASANAIGWAIDAIRLGRADVMLAGGVDVLDILSLAGFDSLKALDSEMCSPYSRSGGLNLGEGAAVLLLEAADQARQRGATIIGYALGYALSSDAHHATAPDPAGSGALRAMRRALETAGLDPSDVDYLNGHGTGTPANDSAEQRAMKSLFPADLPPVPVSSTKSQIGHMLGAAGGFEAAVCAMALRDQVLPPTIGVDPAFPPARDVVAGHGRPAALDVVLSNSFAFGGNNCSLVFGRTERPAPQPLPHPVVITGAGVVAPLGIGRQAFLAAVASGAVAVGPAVRTDTSRARSCLVAEVRPDEYRGLIDRAYARRLDHLGMLVLASLRLALQDAELRVATAESTRLGLVFGTCTGPMGTVASLTETIGTDGPHRVNPRLFPNSVMNAAAGHACLSMQVKGPLSTLATGCAAGLSAVGYAADLVRSGEADVVAAIGADELTPLLHLGYDRLGVVTPTMVSPYDQARSGLALGEGGATVIVESAEHARARKAPIAGEILGYSITADAHRVAGNDRSGHAWAESFRRAMAEAGLDAGDVASIYGDARGVRDLDQAEAAAIGAVWAGGEVSVANLTAQLGHIHATTPVLSLIAALETTRTGWVPAIQNLSDPLPEVGHVARRSPSCPPGQPSLVTAANWGGTYVSMVVGPARDGI